MRPGLSDRRESAPNPKAGFCRLGMIRKLASQKASFRPAAVMASLRTARLSCPGSAQRDCEHAAWISIHPALAKRLDEIALTLPASICPETSGCTEPHRRLDPLRRGHEHQQQDRGKYDHDDRCGSEPVGRARWLAGGCWVRARTWSFGRARVQTMRRAQARRPVYAAIRCGKTLSPVRSGARARRGRWRHRRWRPRASSRGPPTTRSARSRATSRRRRGSGPRAILQPRGRSRPSR